MKLTGLNRKMILKHLAVTIRTLEPEKLVGLYVKTNQKETVSAYLWEVAEWLEKNHPDKWSDA